MTTLELTDAERDALLVAWAIYTSLGLAYLKQIPMALVEALLSVEMPRTRSRQDELESLSRKMTELLHKPEPQKEKFDVRRN